MDLKFSVTKITSAKKAGESRPTFKVSMKSDEGHSLTLKGDSMIQDGFPLGEVIRVSIHSLKTLEEFNK